MARTKGATAIPKRKRAEIIGKVNSHLFTPGKVAAEEGISKRAVQKIVNGEIPDDVAEMANLYEQDFVTYARANALKAQQRTFETINELSADKAAMVAEKNFNMAQIIENKPTAITSDQTSVEYWVNVVRKVAEQTRNEIEAAYNTGVESNWIPPHLRDEVKRKLLGNGNEQL